MMATGATIVLHSQLMALLLQQKVLRQTGLGSNEGPFYLDVDSFSIQS